MNGETSVFAAERPRLVRIAERVLGDAAEAADIVQNAWIRLQGNATDIDNPPGWLTTVTTRLCLDRLRARRSVPEAELDPGDTAPDPADEVALAGTVGVALWCSTGSPPWEPWSRSTSRSSPATCSASRSGPIPRRCSTSGAAGSPVARPEAADRMGRDESRASPVSHRRDGDSLRTTGAGLRRAQAGARSGRGPTPMSIAG